MIMKQVNIIQPESRSDRAATSRIFEADRAKNQAYTGPNVLPP